jgi:hypothetical protein
VVDGLVVEASVALAEEVPEVAGQVEAGKQETNKKPRISGVLTKLHRKNYLPIFCLI